MAQKTASQTRTEAKRGVDETNERSLFFFVCLSGVAVLTRLLFLFATAASPVSRHSLTSAVQSSPAPLPFPNANGSLFFVGFAFVLSLVVLLAVCSNRRHGWFCALIDLLGLATSTGVSPLFVVEDGKCMFNACLLSLNSPRAADELIQDCVNFLSNAGPNDTDLSAIVPTLPNPIVWNEASVLDVMPVVLSKVLRAEILIISKLAGGNPTINRVTNTSVPTSTRIVLLHILNTLVVPQIYHYLGTRVLSSGESATLPDVYRCLSAQPDLCEYATIRTDPHPLLVPVHGEHDELGFEYATLYNHVLCGPGSEMQFLVGDTPMQGLVPALRFRNGTCYYFHPMTRSELSVGRNWRLAVLHQASLLAMNLHTGIVELWLHQRLRMFDSRFKTLVRVAVTWSRPQCQQTRLWSDLLRSYVSELSRTTNCRC
jgi:hypothetical protein